MDKQLCKAGSQPAVTAKNRYQDILPCLIMIFYCCCVETNVVVVYSGCAASYSSFGGSRIRRQ